jgi:phosphatidate cytidylyltransferase
LLFLISATTAIFFKEEILGFPLTPIVLAIIYLVFIVNIFFNFINYRHHFWWIVSFYPGLGCIMYMLQLEDASAINAGFMLWLMLMIWVCDSFQYLFGARFGKRKLLERVSPKKSWEGFIGGGAVVVCFSFIPGKYATFGSYELWFVIGIVVWIIGTLGDLFESSIKRQFNVKDSGSILPGHGGMLDRFDSFIFIIPFVLTAIYYMA